MKAVRTALATFVAGLVFVLPATAELITFEFTGVVDVVKPELAGTFSLNDPATVVYTFDSTAVDGNPNPDLSTYPAIVEFIVTVGAYSATSSAGDILIDDRNISFDGYTAFSGSVNGPDVAGLPIQSCVLSLRDTTFSALDSDALPVIPPDPADFNVGFIRCAFSGSNVIVNATIESSTIVAQVPASSNRSLVVMGLLFATALSILGLRYVPRNATA